MRFYKLWFWLLLGPLSVASCEKDKVETPQPPEYWGEASALLDGNPVDFSVYATHVNGEAHLSIFIDTLSEEGFTRGSIFFDFIPAHIGKYGLRKEYDEEKKLPYAGYSASGSDGDAVLAHYHLVERDTLNYVDLISLEDVSQEISGTFEAYFAIDTIFKDLQPQLADTLKFTQGYFHTKIYKF